MRCRTWYTVLRTLYLLVRCSAAVTLSCLFEENKSRVRDLGTYFLNLPRPLSSSFSVFAVNSAAKNIFRMSLGRFPLPRILEYSRWNLGVNSSDYQRLVRVHLILSSVNTYYTTPFVRNAAIAFKNVSPCNDFFTRNASDIIWQASRIFIA